MIIVQIMNWHKLFNWVGGGGVSHNKEGSTELVYEQSYSLSVILIKSHDYCGGGRGGGGAWYVIVNGFVSNPIHLCNIGNIRNFVGYIQYNLFITNHLDLCGIILYNFPNKQG